MSKLEVVDADNWEEFLAAPVAVLMLARTGCGACAAWTEELVEALEADPDAWPTVRFGKVHLDKPGLADFKRANRWMADIEGLPTTVIFADGERVKTFAGGGMARLGNRLKRFV